MVKHRANDSIELNGYVIWLDIWEMIPVDPEVVTTVRIVA
jgi:hypothetical protein